MDFLIDIIQILFKDIFMVLIVSNNYLEFSLIAGTPLELLYYNAMRKHVRDSLKNEWIGQPWILRIPSAAKPL